MVVVSLDKAGDAMQPDSFRCCPLGLQFYSRKKLDIYKVMKMDLQVPGRAKTKGTFAAEGVVVHAQYDEKQSMYRTWIMFTDLPDEAASRLKCMTKKTGLQCPHCENY